MNNRLSAVVINNSASMRDYVSNLLQEQLGVGVVLEADCADDAVHLISTNRNLGLGCVFNDLETPGMDVKNFLAFLRSTRETAYVPCMLLTEKAQKVAETIALRDGFTDYLSKPFTPELFVEKVSRIWSGSERRRARRVEPCAFCEMNLGFDNIHMHQVELLNISMTGCLVRVPALMKPSGHIYDTGAMELNLDEGEVAKLYGQVVRVEVDYDWRDSDSMLVALNFTELDEENREKLSDYIERCDKAACLRLALC